MPAFSKFSRNHVGALIMVTMVLKLFNIKAHACNILLFFFESCWSFRKYDNVSTFLFPMIRCYLEIVKGELERLNIFSFSSTYCVAITRCLLTWNRQSIEHLEKEKDKNQE